MAQQHAAAVGGDQRQAFLEGAVLGASVDQGTGWRLGRSLRLTPVAGCWARDRDEDGVREVLEVETVPVGQWMPGRDRVGVYNGSIALGAFTGGQVADHAGTTTVTWLPALLATAALIVVLTNRRQRG